MGQSMWLLLGGKIFLKKSSGDATGTHLQKKLMVEAPISTPDPGSWENIDKKNTSKSSKEYYYYYYYFNLVRIFFNFF